MLKKIATEVRPGLHTYAVWVLSSLIDVVALTIWVFLQYGLNRMIVGLKLTGLDAWVFFVLQILTAVSTLAPIALFIYRDVRIMWIKTIHEIQKEIDAKKPRFVSNPSREG